MPIVAVRYVATRFPHTLSLWHRHMEFTIWNTVYNQHITNPWTSLLTITACVRSVHTSSSYENMSPPDIPDVLFPEPPANIASLKSLPSPFSFHRTIPTKHYPHWVQQFTQQAMDINHVTSHCAATIQRNKKCVKTHSEAVVWKARDRDQSSRPAASAIAVAVSASPYIASMAVLVVFSALPNSSANSNKLSTQFSNILQT